MKRIFALTTVGLEEISVEEIASIEGVTGIETDYRRITARCDEAVLENLLNLRTVDDVYLEAAVWRNIEHTRDTLKTLEDHFRQLDLKAVVKTLVAVRPITPKPIFSVTGSFIGKRNYNTDEIKAVVAAGISARQGWRYTSDDREADINIRLFIIHETAYIGLRLGKHPLHERDYKHIERPGALKPSVAAAILKLANVQPGMRLLDPCCGTGTILIEGAGIGAAVRGGDIETEAIQAVRTNALAAGMAIPVEEWDARALPLPDHSVDRIVTNLPWGKQIKVDDELVSFYGDVCREMERLLAPEGRLAVLTSLPQLLHFERLLPDNPVSISLFGQRPDIALFSAYSLNSSPTLRP